MRYFVPSADPAPVAPPRGPLLTHLVDVLRLPWGTSDAVVLTDRKGALHLVTDKVPEGLPGPIRSALTTHELASRRPARRLNARTLYLYALDRADQPLNTPGVDDPVELTGTLYGPFGDPGPGAVVPGTLTVTRGELLAAVLAALPEALMVAGLDGRPARSLHLLLPGDTPEATRAGECLVLCYLLPLAELDPPDVANEPLVKQLLADVLTALQADLRAAGSTDAFTRRPLPVASRPDLEAELERTGWEIRGESAVKLDPALKKGIGGLLTSVLGVPEAMTRALPPEGSLEDFLALAREALTALPESPRTRALSAAALPAAAPPRVPAASGPAAEQATSAAPPPPAAPPTRVAARAQPPAARPTTPDWLDDFGPPRRSTDIRRPPARPAAQSAAGPAKGTRPSWMDDFE